MANGNDVETAIRILKEELIKVKFPSSKIDSWLRRGEIIKKIYDSLDIHPNERIALAFSDWYSMPQQERDIILEYFEFWKNSYLRFYLTPLDLRRFLGNIWINDECIIGYFLIAFFGKELNGVSMILPQFNGRVRRKKADLVSSNIGIPLFQSKFFLQIMYLPNHWVMLLVEGFVENLENRTTCVVHVFDSIKNEESFELVKENFVKQINSLMASHNQIIADPDQHKLFTFETLEFESVDCQQQHGTNDCGIFASTWSSRVLHAALEKPISIDYAMNILKEPINPVIERAKFLKEIKDNV